MIHSNRRFGGAGRRIAPVLAIVFITFAVSAAIQQDPASGSLRGKVYVRDSNRALAGVQIVLDPVLMPNTPGDRVLSRVRTVISHGDGTFVLPHLMAGSYTLSAFTRAHSISGQQVTITEGSATEIFVTLDRSIAPLAVKEHQ